MEDTQQVKKHSIESDWEIKDRIYFLKGKKPLTLRLATRHSPVTPMLYFDSDLGYQRELRYAENQRSPFVDEQKGISNLGHIVFQKGKLFVPKEQQNLQKLLSLYHPQNGKTYEEYKPKAIATNDLDYLDLELAATSLAANIDMDTAEAILRVENGSSVSDLSSKELKRDIRLFARRNPSLFLELANDENVQLRNFGIKATEAGILSLSQDQRTFSWSSNGRVLMKVPFEEHPYSALAAWFKTDEGLAVYKSVEKKMK